MTANLGLFPPDIMQLISWYLEADSLAKLVLLCGNTHLSTLLAKRGGAHSLVARSAAALDALRRCGVRLCSLPRLTSLTLVDSTTRLHEYPDLAQFIAALPSTMLEIRIRAATPPLNAFSWPLILMQDDAVAICASSQGNMTPISLKERFPALRLLQLQGPQCDWNPLTFARFMENLPHSLTSLCLPQSLCCPFHRNMTLLPIEVLRNLEQWTTDFFSHTRHVPVASHRPPTPTANTEDYNYEFITQMQNLRELSAYTVGMSFGPFIAPLANLSHLTLQSDTELEIVGCLPPCLTWLKVGRVSASCFADLRAELCFPTLTYLFTEIQYRATGPHLSLNIESFPPNLTSLTIKLRPPSCLFRCCPFPTSLTYLMLNLQIAPYAVIDFSSLNSLNTLYGEANSKKFFLTSSIPPSLTTLGLNDDQCLGIDDLKVIPSWIRRFSAAVTIESPQASCFAKIGPVWSIPTAQECLRAKYCPQIASKDFEIDIVFGQFFMQTLQACEELRAVELPGMNLSACDPFPASATSVRCGQPPAAATLQDLPQALITFEALYYSPTMSKDLDEGRRGGSKWHDVVRVRLADVLSDPLHALPSTLQSLRLNRPQALQDKVQSGRLVLYPPLQLCPHLHTLIIDNPSYDGIGALLTLPSTITSLTVTFSLREQSKVLQQVGDDWLPNLRHLRLAHCILHVRCFLNRIDRFETFTSDTMFVHSSALPATMDDFPTILNNSSLSHYLQRKLFPPHLRRQDIHFIVQWTKESVAKLPAHLERAHVTYVLSLVPELSADNLGKYLPRGLKQLTLDSAIAHHFKSMKHLPPQLTALELFPLRAPKLSGLPTSLLSLSLVMNANARIRLTRAMVDAMPRNLESLSVWVYKVEKDALTILPPHLIQLMVSIYDFHTTPLPVQSLPTSLVSLSAHGWDTTGDLAESIRARLPNLRLLSLDPHVHEIH